MVIQHNISSINTNRQLGISTENKKKSTERLASGYRINRAADDAAGLTVSEKMRWSVRGLRQASRNIEDGTSLVQTADGGMEEIHAILQRQRELSVQAANDTNTAADRNAIQQEINALSVEITRIANDTTFNGRNILNCGGNLTHGPVNADTAVTTLLGTPGSTPGGILTGFMATNAEGSIQSQLLYGGSSANTSFLEAKVAVGTPPSQNNYTLRTKPLPAECQITNDAASIADGVKTTFTYQNAATGNPVFSIVRTVQKTANPTGDGGEVYKMDFAIENHTTEPMNASLEVSMDVMFTGNDNPSFLMDNDVDETIITNAIQYPDASGHMPGVMNLFSTNNPYLNVQSIVNGYGTTQPDYIKIGQYNHICGDDWRAGISIGDSAYDVGWQNISIAPGAASGAYTTMYGVSNPLRNPVLAGSHSVPVELNIQASDRAYTAITIPLVDCTAEKLGVDALSVMSFDESGTSLNKIDKAIDKVSEYRSNMGAIYNRLEKAKSNVDNIEENTQSAESRIRDADVAEEMVAYSRHNILEQTGQAMLAQAGKMNEGVLELLQ